MSETPFLTAQDPWPGLRAFGEQDQHFFFGRERETTGIVALIERAPVTVLYGQSGLGKTSLLQAGVLPEIRKRDYLPVAVRLDHEAEAPPLERQLLNALAAELRRVQVSAPVPRDDESLWEYFHRRDVDFWSSRNRLLTPVLIIDQFEEIFTLGRRNLANTARTDAFVAQLESLLEHRPPESVRRWLEESPDEARRFNLRREATKLVLSLREDFLPHLDSWRSRIPSLLPNRYRLHRMTATQALDVVTRSGGELVDGPVARDIVDFVSASRRDRRDLPADDLVVEPALLSLVCHELNRRRVDRGRDKITADLLMGEQQSIIQSFYDRSFDEVDPRVRDWVEDELLTASGYRDRAALEDAIRLGLPVQDFDTLVDRRLLHREERSGVLWLELTHDLLTDPASDSRTKREQRRREDESAAREAGVARELRRTRRTAAFFAAMLVLMVAVAAYAMVQRRSADESRGAAVTAAATAEANLTTASDLIDRVSLDVSGEIWTPTPAILRKIQIVDESFARLSSALTPEMQQRYVRYLAQAANALYDAGRVREGLEYAKSAVIEAGDGSGVGRAEAFAARARGLFETGRFGEATQDASMAAMLAEDDSNVDVLRVSVRAYFLLTSVALRRYEREKAQTYLENISRRLQPVEGRGTEADIWRARIEFFKGFASARVSEELTHYARATTMFQMLLMSDADNPLIIEALTNAEYRLALTASSLGDSERARALARSSVDRANSLIQRDPQNWQWLYVLANANWVAGSVQFSQGAWDLARRSYEESEKVYAKVRDTQPDWFRPAEDHAGILMAMGSLSQARAKPAQSDPEVRIRTWQDADAHYLRAERELRDVVARVPEDLTLIRDLARSISGRGYVEADRVKPDYAKVARVLNESLATLTGIREATTSDLLLQESAVLRLWIGFALDRLDKPREAIAAYREAATLLEELRTRNPTPSVFHDLSEVYLFQAGTLLREKDTAGVQRALARAMQASDGAVDGRPTDVGYLRRRATIAKQLAEASRSRGDFKRAVDAVETGAGSLWSAIQLEFGNGELREDLSALRKEADAIRSTLPKDQPDSARMADALTASFKPIDLQRFYQKEPQGTWSLPPLIPGAWQTVSRADWARVMKRLSDATKGAYGTSDARRIRSLQLDFYERGVLYEVEVAGGVVAFLERGADAFVVDGTSPGIHRLNTVSPPRLDTPARAESYMRFFVGALSGDDGRFQIVDQLEDIQWKPAATDVQKSRVKSTIRPLVIEPISGGGWQGVGTWLYSGRFYNVILWLKRDGMMGLADDSEQFSLPVLVQRYTSALRVLTSGTDWKAAVTKAAATVESGKAALIKEPGDQEVRRNLVGAYLNLSWYQTLVGDFMAALASTDAGILIDAEFLPLRLNRAHALLFLGRIQEAEDVYQNNIGKQVGDDRQWEQEALSDFDTLEGEGHTHRAFARLRELMKTPAR